MVKMIAVVEKLAGRIIISTTKTGNHNGIIDDLNEMFSSKILER
jgi:hypothetical protein